MNKIDKRKKYSIVFDIETTNDLIDNLAYDIGFIVIDKQGNVYEQHSYMVSELFLDYKDLLDSAYYKEKLPQYWQDFQDGKREMCSIFTIQKKMKQVIKKYNIKEMWAYNCSFDVRGLNKTLRYISKSKFRWFFPYGLDFKCIWNVACQTIFQQKTFFKLALLNGWLTNNGNVQTSAEIAYNYINKTNDFQEEHQGLDDCLIEKDILIKCMAQHKKINPKIDSLCWRLPQKNFKKFLKKA